jgi:hypothetical protein
MVQSNSNEVPNGLVSQDEFRRIMAAQKCLSRCFFDVPSQGWTIEGVDYLPLDLVADYSEAKESLEILSKHLEKFSFLENIDQKGEG